MILLVGATGAVGSRVLDGLVANQQPIRVLTRGSDDWKGTSVASLRNRGIDTILGDIRDPDMVERSMKGCKAVINMAGILRQTPEATYQDVNVEGVRHLVSSAQRLGVQRFIHVSCLTPEGVSDFPYVLSRRESESIVSESKLYWTIFRPSFIFSDHCRLLELMGPLIVKPPVVPVVGGGLNVIQPVHADDVSACVLQSIYNRDTVGRSYELVGPERISILQLTQRVLAVLSVEGKTKATVNIPTAVALKAARMTGGLLPKVPVSMDIIQMLISDSVADPMPMMGTFKVAMRSFDDSLDGLARSLA